MSKKINNWEELLAELVLDEPVEFVISNGFINSGKTLYLLKDGNVEVWNEIDDTTDIISKDSRDDDTNIFMAMNKGIFWKRGE